MNRSKQLLSLLTGVCSLFVAPLMQSQVHAQAITQAITPQASDAQAAQVITPISEEPASAPLTPSPITKLFVPDLFDDNDNVQIILQGTYKDNCMTAATSGFTIDENRRVVEVWAQSSYKKPAGSHDGNRQCLDGHFPFIQVVDVGALAAGDYTVVYRHNPDLTQALTIRPNTGEASDETLYAPVDYIAVAEQELTDSTPASNAREETERFEDTAAGSQLLTLVGTFPLLYIGCMQLKTVHVDQGPEDVLIVRPEAEVIEGSAGCPKQDAGAYKFEFSTPLPESSAESMLIHIRLPDGGSLNRLLLRP